MFGFFLGLGLAFLIAGAIWYRNSVNRPAVGGLGGIPVGGQPNQPQGVGQIPDLVNPIPVGQAIGQVIGGTILFAVIFFLPYWFIGWQWLHTAWCFILFLSPAFWFLIGFYRVPMEHLRLLLWGGNAMFTVGRLSGITNSRWYWRPIWWGLTQAFTTALVSIDIEIKGIMARGGTLWDLTLRLDFYLVDLYVAMVRHSGETAAREHLRQIVEGLGPQLTGKLTVQQMAALQAVLGDVQIDDQGNVFYQPQGQLSPEEQQVQPVALARVEAVVEEALTQAGFQIAKIDVQGLKSTDEVMKSLRQHSLIGVDRDRGNMEAQVEAARSRADNAGTVAILDALSGTERDEDGNVTSQGRPLTAKELYGAGILEHGVDVLVEGGGAAVQVPAQGHGGGQRRGQRQQRNPRGGGGGNPGGGNNP